jgi:polyisoprenoid-binding protein YceI
VTLPLTLNVRFNGGYPVMELDPHGRVGFSATGSLNRSDFGRTMGLPSEGSTMGVFDEVTIRIETEMVRSPTE